MLSAVAVAYTVVVAEHMVVEHTAAEAERMVVEDTAAEADRKDMHHTTADHRVAAADRTAFAAAAAAVEFLP